MEGTLSRFVLARTTHEARVGTLWSPGAAWRDVTAGRQDDDVFQWVYRCSLWYIDSV